jgi:hypothetical protein
MEGNDPSKLSKQSLGLSSRVLVAVWVVLLARFAANGGSLADFF